MKLRAAQAAVGHGAAGRAEHPEGVLLPAGAAVPACTNAPKLLYTLLALLAPVSFSRPGLRKVFALGAQPRDAGLPVWRPGAVRGEPSPRRDGGRGGSGWDGDGDPAARGGSRQGTARSPVRGTAPASPGRLQQPRGTQRSQPPHGHAYRCGGQRLSLWLGGGGVCSSCCTSAEALPSACLQQPGATTQPCAPAPASPPSCSPRQMWRRVEVAAASPQPRAPHGAAPSPRPPLAPGQRSASPTSYLCPGTKKRWCQRERCEEHPQEHPQPCRRGRRGRTGAALPGPCRCRSAQPWRARLVSAEWFTCPSCKALLCLFLLISLV